MRDKKELESLTSSERGNLIIVTCMSSSGIYVALLNVFPRKKYEREAYGWSRGGLNFGLPSKWLDSHGYIY